MTDESPTSMKPSLESEDLRSNNETISEKISQLKACHKIPRIEVQFLCDRNIVEEGLNATRIFEEYYSTEVFGGPEGSQNNQSESISWLEKLYLYVTVGANRVDDVSPHQRYFRRCDASSNDTLVSVDVRGNALWSATPPPPFDYPLHSNLRDFLESRVCGGDSFGYFNAHIREWHESSYPIPGKDCLAVPGTFNHLGGYATYPSSSILNEDGSPVLEQQHQQKQQQRHPHPDSYYKEYYWKRYQTHAQTHGYTFDQNLHLLCGGANETGSQDLASPLFLLFAVLGGYVMVLMIKVELVRPLRYQQLPPRYPQSGRRSFWDLFRSGTSTAAVANHGDDSDSDESSDSSEDEEEEYDHGQEIELAALNR